MEGHGGGLQRGATVVALDEHSQKMGRKARMSNKALGKGPEIMLNKKTTDEGTSNLKYWEYCMDLANHLYSISDGILMARFPECSSLN